MAPDGMTAKLGFHPKTDKTVLALWKQEMNDKNEEWRLIIAQLLDVKTGHDWKPMPRGQKVTRSISSSGRRSKPKRQELKSHQREKGRLDQVDPLVRQQEDLQAIKTPLAPSFVQGIARQQTSTLKLRPHSSADELERRLEKELRQNIEGTLRPRVVTGLGKEFCYQNGGQKAIEQIKNQRTASTLESEKQKEPVAQASVKQGRDWISELIAQEPYIGRIAGFSQTIDVDKMIHVVADGGARPNPGSSGWGVVMQGPVLDS
jgi:hypothetical protein